MTRPIISIRDLTLRDHTKFLLDIPLLTIDQGAAIALTGPSGAGKSLLAATLLGLTPPTLTRSAHQLTIAGIDLLTASPQQLRRLRGGLVGLVFQEPQGALDPQRPLARHIDS
jgi:ABC-type microcin C transport system duplicated ATPase subunit YejF